MIAAYARMESVLARHGLTPHDVSVVNLSAGDAAAAFISGRVDVAVVWNPWISQIEKSGKGRALFTSRDMPGLIPDLLVAQQSAIQNKRQDLVGMTRAWFDTVAFIQNNPDAAVKIMSKVVGMNPADYKVFLPGTRFFDTAATDDAFFHVRCEGALERTTGYSDDGDIFRKQASLLEVIERRQKLVLGEIA